MKVIVTKDSWGVDIWKEGTKLVYKKPFIKLAANPQHTVPQAIDLDSKKVWMVGQQWPFGKKLYNNKMVKKLFPELIDELKISDKIQANLTIIL